MRISGIGFLKGLGVAVAIGGSIIAIATIVTPLEASGRHAGALPFRTLSVSFEPTGNVRVRQDGIEVVDPAARARALEAAREDLDTLYAVWGNVESAPRSLRLNSGDTRLRPRCPDRHCPECVHG